MGDFLNTKGFKPRNPQEPEQMQFGGIKSTDDDYKKAFEVMQRYNQQPESITEAPKFGRVQQLMQTKPQIQPPLNDGLSIREVDPGVPVQQPVVQSQPAPNIEDSLSDEEKQARIEALMKQR